MLKHGHCDFHSYDVTDGRDRQRTPHVLASMGRTESERVHVWTELCEMARMLPVHTRARFEGQIEVRRWQVARLGLREGGRARDWAQVKASVGTGLQIGFGLCLGIGLRL